MEYPTMAQVEAADREQLARWYRFLPSPGESVTDKPNHQFKKEVNEQAAILRRVDEQFRELEFFTPKLSKAIGWDKPE